MSTSEGVVPEQKGIDIDTPGKSQSKMEGGNYRPERIPTAARSVKKKMKRNPDNIWLVILWDAVAIFSAAYIMLFFQGMANIIGVENPTFDPIGPALMSGIGVWIAFTVLWHLSSEVNAGLTVWRPWMPDWRRHYGGWGTGFAAWGINLAVLLGAGFLAAFTCWELQVANAVTHAGVPTIGGSATTAGVMEGLGSFFWGWVFFATKAWFTGEDPKLAGVMPGGPIILGLAHTGLVYLAHPYSMGSFNPFFWLPFAIVGNYFQTDYWIYIIGPLIGFFAITILWFFLYQSPEDEEIIAALSEEDTHED